MALAWRLRRSIADRFAQYQAGFNLLGRLTVLKAARAKVKKPLPLMTGSHLFTDAPPDRGRDDQAIYSSFDLPATGAIGYLRNLTPVTRDLFDGLTRQYKQDAITIAGVNDQRILQKVRDALAEVVMEGGTPADFRKVVNSITDEAGAARLASFEIDTVFNTNVHKAYSPGRYGQMKGDAVLEALPFWQYRTVGDTRVRPEHKDRIPRAAARSPPGAAPGQRRPQRRFDGEFDGCDELWDSGLQRLLFTSEADDPTKFRFHSGCDAVIGSGSSPVSAGGDQGVDTWWGSFPAGIQPLHYNRIAYYGLFLKLVINDPPGKVNQNDPSVWADLNPVATRGPSFSPGRTIWAR